MLQPYDYDLLVIGSGPGGQKAAIAASKLGKRVAMVERDHVVGGVCINTGTIPSKTMREAVINLSGYRERAYFGGSYGQRRVITIDDLLLRCQTVVKNEIEVTRHQLTRNGIEIITGLASFIDPHTIAVNDDEIAKKVTAQNIVIAVGTSPVRPPNLPFGRALLDSDSILNLDRIPRSMCVIGGGVIGLEYASIFAALGVRVTLIDKRDRLLSFVDSEVVEALSYHLRSLRVTFRLNEEVESISVEGTGADMQVQTRLKSGKSIVTDRALYSAGRTGNTAALNLENAQIGSDARGKITVNDQYQTSQPHVFAVGDVIGFPSLASVAMEQGRIAANVAFGRQLHSVPDLFPYGIYTVPEISVLGKNEDELTSAGIPYEIGKAHYREIARGQIIGDSTGFLKILFSPDDHKVLGVHIIGEGASELIHIGQAVLAFGGTIDYFVDTVFNYPTLAECYKVAALDGVNRQRL